MKRFAQLAFTMLLALGLLYIPIGSQSYIGNTAFLPTAGISVAAGATSTNGTNFGSGIIRVSHAGYASVCAITITFTRTTGTADTVDFEFQASYDNNTTWSTVYYVRIQTPTNDTAVSNVVIKTTPVNIYGISHLRLYRVVNNCSSTNLTACNATVSFAVAN